MKDESQVIFKVNKERGICICILTGCAEIARKRICKYAPHVDFDWWDKRLDITIKDKYVGVAKCAPEDTFDKEYGKKLALMRAKAKRCKDVNSVICQAIDIVKREVSDLVKYGIHEVPTSI